MRVSLFNYATIEELYKMNAQGYEFTIEDGEIKNAVKNQEDSSN